MKRDEGKFVAALGSKSRCATEWVSEKLRNFQNSNLFIIDESYRKKDKSFKAKRISESKIQTFFLFLFYLGLFNKTFKIDFQVICLFLYFIELSKAIEKLVPLRNYLLALLLFLRSRSYETKKYKYDMIDNWIIGVVNRYKHE